MYKKILKSYLQIFGLIESNWGGTIIEAWMPQEPLGVCDVDPWIDPNPNSPNSNSYLYNAMIHPLVRVSIKGVLWYQGMYLPYPSVLDF